MQQKENLLSTQKGKIIAVSSGLVGVVVIYLLLAWLIGFWPFSSLTKTKINAMVIDPGKVKDSILKDTATSKVGDLDKGYSSLEKAAKTLKKDDDEEVKKELTTLKSSIQIIKDKLSAASFNGAEFATEYNKLDKGSFQKVADAIIKAADLK
uniref:Immunodominant membrane protein n=1 Tax=Sesame phyllody phytoplasma TaxID=420408 RepID=A0A7L8YRG7_9MOLU|nr:immunodominant membrane protein [Sesame phyllody phytoplasma]